MVDLDERDGIALDRVRLALGIVEALPEVVDATAEHPELTAVGPEEPVALADGVYVDKDEVGLPLEPLNFMSVCMVALPYSPLR